MSKKQTIITIYLVIGLLFGLYQWFLGPMAYKGLMYNLGRGLVWPALMFPAFGHAIGAIVIVVLVIVVLVL